MWNGMASMPHRISPIMLIGRSGEIQIETVCASFDSVTRL
jgi:hypothetical protein